MPFTLHPATVSDAPSITTIFHAAFANDHIMRFLHPHVAASALFESDLKYFTELISQGYGHGERITKVVDEESGEIVAFSGWQYPYTPTEEERRKREAKISALRDEPLEGSNKALAKEYYTKMFEGRKRWIVPERTFFVHILAVHPTYHRRGLGTMLLRPGLEDADKAGAQTYIEASPSGLPLYLRHGWVQVDELVIDMKPHGGEGVERNPCLMREPGAGSKVGKAEG